MKKFTTALLLVFIGIIANEVTAQDGDPDQVYQKLQEAAIVEHMKMVPMRDGKRLATHIFRPKTDKKVPIIFSRHPYNINRWIKSDKKEDVGGLPTMIAKRNTGLARRAYEAVKRGYAYVVQNERGRYFSEGKWQILGYPLTDASDMFEWMRGRPWSNGKIGLWGCSSSAEWQLGAASLENAADAMVPMGYGAGIGTVGKYHEQGNWFRGGVFQMLFASWLYSTEQDEDRPRIPEDASREDRIRVSRYYDLRPMSPSVDWNSFYRTLPIQNLTKAVNGKKQIFNEMIRRNPDDPAWYKGGLYHDTMPFRVPSFWFVSWYDISAAPNLALFDYVQENGATQEVRDSQYMVIFPTLHCDFKGKKQTVVGERNMGDTRLKPGTDEMIYDWFDYWLKGEKNNFKEKHPPVRYYTMGSNEWQSAEQWPPQNTRSVKLYLDSGGEANSLYGDGKLVTGGAPEQNRPDEYTYDPMNPVPTLGGGICCMGDAAEPGALDQRRIEARQDVLVYSSKPLEEGVEVTGYIEPVLYVSSDVPDTDFTVKLVDVYPDGTAYNIRSTVKRARYRNGFDQQSFMEEDSVYKITLSPMATSNFFKKGHRIRIEVSSSNFPHYARNMNTKEDNYASDDPQVAHNKIHHSQQYPSHINLMIKERSLPLQLD